MVRLGMALQAAQSVFVTATSSITTLAAPANPLLMLPAREALVFLAKAKGLPMPAVAEALGISRQRCYQLLDRARATLTPIAASRV